MPLRKLVAVVLALSVGACAINLVKTPTPDKLASYKSIGVISTVGDVVTTTYESGIGFTHDLKSKSSQTDSSWQIDDYVTGIVTDQLKGRFDVMRLAYRGDFRATYYPLGQAVDIGQIIHASAPSQPLDAYIVVTKAWGSPGCVQNSPCNYFFGLGLRRTFVILRSDHVAVFADYTVSLVDGRTGAVFGTPLVGDLTKDVDETWWAESFDQTSPEQKQQLQDALKSMFAKALPGALRTTGIIP